jgi:hypothetical protein
MYSFVEYYLSLQNEKRENLLRISVTRSHFSFPDFTWSGPCLQHIICYLLVITLLVLTGSSTESRTAEWTKLQSNYT